MLVIRFSIGCSEKHAKEVLNTLNEYGTQVSREEHYNEKVLSNEREPVIYYECLLPYGRIKSLIEEFDNEKYGTVILTY